MKRLVCFTVPGVEGQRRPRVKRGGGAYKSRQDREREKIIRAAYETASTEAYGRIVTAPAGTPVRVAIACARNVKADLRKRDGDTQPDTSYPDLDNICKSVLDALNPYTGEYGHPGAWADDAQVDQLHAYKLMRVRGAEAFTRVTIEWED